MTSVRIPWDLRRFTALIGFGLVASDVGASDDYEFVAKPTGIQRREDRG